MKKINFTLFLLCCILITGQSQPFQGNEKGVWYEPDTILAFDIQYPTKTDLIPWEKIIYTYDANALRLSEVRTYWDYDQSSFTNTNGRKTLYTYNSDNLLESQTQQQWNNVSSSWENQYFNTYAYQLGNMTEEVQSAWDTATLSFLQEMRFLYTYDEHNNPVLFESQSWNDSLQAWQPWHGYTTDYVYDNDFNILSKVEVYMNSTDSNIYTYTYDANGNMLSETYAYATLGVYTNYNYLTYAYDANNNLIKRVTYEWDADSNDYIYASWDGRITYSYDASNNRISHLRETYDYDQQGWLVDGWNPRLDWTYENDNAVLINAYEFDYDIFEWVPTMSGHVELHYNNMKSTFEMWTGGHQFEISYQTFQTPVLVKPNDYIKITCYPNPTQDVLYLSGLLEKSKLVIYDLNGRIVQKTNVSNSLETIDMSNLQNGLYFIEISNSHQKSSYKIVKQ